MYGVVNRDTEIDRHRARQREELNIYTNSFTCVSNLSRVQTQNSIVVINSVEEIAIE